MARRSSQPSWQTMREKGKPRRGGDALPFPNARWWTLKPEQTPGAILSTIEHIRNRQTSLRQQRAICARLYGGLAPGSAYGTTGSRMVHPSSTGRLTYNITSIVSDSLVSKVTKSKVRPLFLTQGGNYRQQRRAKKLSQFAEGIFYETKFDQLAPMIFRDACVVADGFVKVFEDRATGRVAIERVMEADLHVDEVDGFYGNPTQLHQTGMVDKQKLLDMFAEDKEATKAISLCSPGGSDLGGEQQIVSEAIGVCESWHLPSSKGADDGLHIIVCDRGELFREKWTRMRFPFARMPWKPKMYGWHSSGLVEDLIGTQVEMNHLLFAMQRSFRAMGTFKIIVENGTIPDSHFNNTIGTILHKPKGASDPSYLAPPALNPQYFEHFERIKSRGFEIARLSAMTATGQSSTGLDASGEARRVQHDIEGEGFQYIGHVYEQFHLDVIALAIDVVRDIHAREKKGYKLKSPVTSSSMPGAQFLRSIDWSKVSLDEDEYIQKCYPISALPSTPQGKLATVTDLARAGYIDQETARKLMDFPDLAQVMTLLGAAEEWINSVLDKIIEDGDYNPPDGLMILPMAEKLCLQEISLGEAQDLEPEVLDDLRTWLGQVRQLKAKAQAAVMAEAAMLPPGQGAVPAAAPTSNLLPPAGAQPALAAAA